MAREWGSIPGLRLDKYLLLCRMYVEGGFRWLEGRGWERELVRGYLGIMGEVGLSTGKDGQGAKVLDGLRYHVLDVWVDGLEGKDVPEGVLEVLIRPVETVGKEGWTRVLRERAKSVLKDERLEEWRDGVRKGDEEIGEEDWEGFGD